MGVSTVEIPNDLVARLRKRAERDGVAVEDLASQALSEWLDQDPHEFIGIGASDRARGSRADDLLAEHNFGRDR